MTRRLVTSLVLLTIVFCTTRCLSQIDANNYGLVPTVPREDVNRWLSDEMAKHGSPLEKGRYHFVIGFSTGHYNTDPVHAIAMRRLAFSLLNNTFAVGDKATPLAWEMSLWKVGRTETLTRDPATRAAFVDDVAYAPAPDSKGGHDVERALYDTLNKPVVPPGEASSSVILMLTNSNQSQSPTGTRAQLLGDGPKLRTAFKNTGYEYPPVRHSFVLRSANRTLTVDVTALFPTKVKPLPGTSGQARYPTFARDTWQPSADAPAATETLPNPIVTTRERTVERNSSTSSVVTTPKPKKNWLPFIILILIIFAVVLYLLMKKPKTYVAETPQKVQEAPKGQPVAGTIRVTIGANQTELKPITTISCWQLMSDSTGAIALSAEEKPEGNQLAKLTIDTDRKLRLEAVGDAQFEGIQPPGLREASAHLIRLAPGETMFCRTGSSTGSTRTRLEIDYGKQ